MGSVGTSDPQHKIGWGAVWVLINNNQWIKSYELHKYNAISILSERF
jgi:hypothetical protein